jgi:hypothetical protein
VLLGWANNTCTKVNQDFIVYNVLRALILIIQYSDRPYQRKKTYKKTIKSHKTYINIDFSLSSLWACNKSNN